MTKTKDSPELKRRIVNSKAIIGRPEDYYGPTADDEPPVSNGRHYEVLSTTAWDGFSVPTLVRWVHGPTDDFTDRMQSLDNRAVARESTTDSEVTD